MRVENHRAHRFFSVGGHRNGLSARIFCSESVVVAIVTQCYVAVTLPRPNKGLGCSAQKLLLSAKDCDSPLREAP